MRGTSCKAHGAWQLERNLPGAQKSFGASASDEARIPDSLTRDEIPLVLFVILQGGQFDLGLSRVSLVNCSGFVAQRFLGKSFRIARHFSAFSPRITIAMK